MYDWLPEACSEIRSNLVNIYWIAIAPLVIFLIILEFFEVHERPPNAMRVIHRSFLSIVMLISFPEVMHLISSVGEAIVQAISTESHIKQLLGETLDFIDSMEISWLKYKETIIWIFTYVSFVFAYFGAFVVEALVNFTWAILYVLSPLMILAYIPQRTSSICISLYEGLCKVMVWKILLAVLGMILLKLTTNAPIEEGGSYNFVLLIVVNLFIGVSLLFIPSTARAFLKSDFSEYAAGLASAPVSAAKGMVMAKAAKTLGLFKTGAQRGLSMGARFGGEQLRRITRKTFSPQNFKGIRKKFSQKPSKPKDEFLRKERPDSDLS